MGKLIGLLSLAAFVLLVNIPAASAQTPVVCLDDWEFYEFDNTWSAPNRDGYIAGLDLRVNSQTGPGIFTYESQAFCTGTLFGGLDHTLTSAQRLALETATGQDLTAYNTLRESLWALFTELSDPRGLTGKKPVRGKVRSMIQLRLPPFGVIEEERYNTAHRERIIDVFKWDYRRIRPDHTEPGTGRIDEQLGRFIRAKLIANGLSDPLDILPAEFRDDAPRTPHTLVTDDFNYTDELGNNSWTEEVCDWEADGDDAFINATGGDGRCQAYHDTAQSTDDHYCQVQIINSNNFSGKSYGCIARYGGTQDWYGGGAYNSANFRVIKRTGSSYTEIVSSGTFDDDDVVKFEVDGSNLDLFVNGSGTPEISTTDSDVTGGTSTGLYSNDGNTSWDDWESDGLGAAPARRIIFIQ